MQKKEMFQNMLYDGMIVDSVLIIELILTLAFNLFQFMQQQQQCPSEARTVGVRGLRPRGLGVWGGAPKARRSRGARGGAPEKKWCFSCDFFNFRRRFDPYRRPCCCCLHREIDKQKHT
jgi:hypothetical protein